MKFTTHAKVLERRDDYIRGIGREVSRYNCHIATAAFAENEIEQITSKDIRDWYRWMSTREAIVHEGESPRRLSKATISRCASLLSVIFSEAVEEELIEISPCFGVKPKKRVDETDTVQKWTFLTMEEQLRIWACAADRAELLAMMIAAGTGMRPCEQFNMRRPDFVIDGPEPHVNIRLSHPHKGKDAPPKNGKMRKVPLMEGRTLDAAREWTELLPTFAPNNPLDLVFPTRRGCLRQQGKWLGRSRDVRAIYKLADVPKRPHLNWYALRHTFASNLVSGALGRYWRLEEIQVLMGHSSVTITQMYAHLGEDAIKKAVREANAITIATAAVVPTPVVSETSASPPALPIPEPALKGANDGADRKRTFARGAELAQKHIDRVRVSIASRMASAARGSASIAQRVAAKVRMVRDAA